MYRIIILCFLLHMSSSGVVEKIRPAVKHRYFWRDFTGIIPKDAFKATDGLYVGQVILDGIMSGGFYPQSVSVVTEFGGRKTVVKNTIKILCDRRKDNFEWEEVNVFDLSPQILKNKVVGGFEEGSITYIGRIYHEGQWKIGKVFPPPHHFEGLNVWNNYGQKYIVDDFEILNYLGKEANTNVSPVITMTTPKSSGGKLTNQGKWFEFPTSWFDCNDD